jgi:hypothetical protein
MSILTGTLAGTFIKGVAVLKAKSFSIIDFHLNIRF